MFPYISDIFNCMFYEHQFLSNYLLSMSCATTLAQFHRFWLRRCSVFLKLRSHKSWKSATVKMGLKWGHIFLSLMKCFFKNVPMLNFWKLYYCKCFESVLMWVQLSKLYLSDYSILMFFYKYISDRMPLINYDAFIISCHYCEACVFLYFRVVLMLTCLLFLLSTQVNGLGLYCIN